MKGSSAALVAATLMFATTGMFAAGGSASAQDAGKGKSVFNQCMACHQLKAAMVGPPLAGVIGRKAGSVEGFSYSPLMKAAGEAGLTWNDTELATYLKDPTAYLTKFVKDKGKAASGASKMSFKLANEQQAKDVAAYLATEK